MDGRFVIRVTCATAICFFVWLFLDGDQRWLVAVGAFCGILFHFHAESIKARKRCTCSEMPIAKSVCSKCGAPLRTMSDQRWCFYQMGTIRIGGTEVKTGEIRHFCDDKPDGHQIDSEVRK